MREITSREVFRTPAVLRSLESFCVAQCLVETSNGYFTSGMTYTRCRIVNESPNVPDGSYRVEFSGHSIRINKVRGQWEWELVFLAPRVPTSESRARIADAGRDPGANPKLQFENAS